MIPIGGMYPSIIDYEIVDAQQTKETLKVRVRVIIQEEKLFGEEWDIEIAQGKIKSMKKPNCLMLTNIRSSQVLLIIINRINREPLLVLSPQVRQ